MATWSKVKQQMESFLAEGLIGTIQYTSGSYRYSKDKVGQCYLKVGNEEVFSVTKIFDGIVWYQNEQEIKKVQQICCDITTQEIDSFHQAKPMIPIERINIILREQKVNEYAKKIMEAQTQLLRSNFIECALQYQASSIEKSMESNEILFNVFALIDRRMGKSRLRKMKDTISQKHPVVQYFYQLRCRVESI